MENGRKKTATSDASIIEKFSLELENTLSYSKRHLGG
jgi:hypothetical protein